MNDDDDGTPANVANIISPSSTSKPFVTSVTLSITNQYDFTDDLWEVLEFGWQVELDGVVVVEGRDLVPSSPCPSSHDGSQEGEGVNNDGGDGSGGSDGSDGTGAASASGATVGGASGGGESGGGGGRVATATLKFEMPSLPLPGEECRLTVTGRLRAAMPWAEAGHVVGHAQLELRLQTSEDAVSRQAPLVQTSSVFVVRWQSFRGLHVRLILFC